MLAVRALSKDLPRNTGVIAKSIIADPSRLFFSVPAVSLLLLLQYYTVFREAGYLLGLDITYFINLAAC